MSPIKKIALIGPESSGKTTLAIRLAEHFQTRWVPEFSREYINSLAGSYTLGDIEHCVFEQLSAEEILEQDAQQFLFCDTELILAKVWCEDVFKTSPAWLEEKIKTHRYDLFLLTEADLPFVPDPVRENPARREFFFQWYKRELDIRKFPYEIITGKDELRFLSALSAIKKHFP